MTAIKFCGMTRAEDVDVAAQLGVDAVGFVLWPASPRHVAVDAARALIRRLPPGITPVGVLVCPSPDEIREALDAGVHIVQIHGETRPRPNDAYEQWIAASLGSDGLQPPVDDTLTVLLDAHDPERHGGTGRTIDWSQAAVIAARRRVMLAGGLTPGNVAAAIQQVHPYGVDVSSGIEDAPGRKNPHAMNAFVAAVRKADQ